MQGRNKLKDLLFNGHYLQAMNIVMRLHISRPDNAQPEQVAHLEDIMGRLINLIDDDFQIDYIKLGIDEDIKEGRELVTPAMARNITKLLHPSRRGEETEKLNKLVDDEEERRRNMN